MSTETISNGRFQWTLGYRRLRGDEGISVSLMGPVGANTQELMRFDCFKNDPHFHTAVYDHNTIEKIDHSDPFEWMLSHCCDSFDTLVANSGGDTPDRQEMSGHLEVIEKLRVLASELTPTA